MSHFAIHRIPLGIGNRALAIFAFLSLASCKKEPHRPIPNGPDSTKDSTIVPVDTSWARPTQDLTIYEVNLRAQGPDFTFTGFVPRMDSIKALGMNTLWIMPIYPIGQLRGIGSPYCVRNYTAVHPDFGTMESFRAMVAEAHKRKLSVILDWVANHTSWDHPWIASHPDWYTRNAAGQIIYPPTTNWQDVADLNFGNAEMRLEMIKAMKFWVQEAGVDGFRHDAANYVPSSFWKQALDSLKRMPTPRPLILLAEGDSVSQLQAGFQMNYAWAFYGQLKNVYKLNQAATTLFTRNTAEYRGLPAGVEKLRFTTNHDETMNDNPPVTLFGGKAGALAASAATYFLGGVPMLYNGQEIAATARLNIATKYTLNWAMNPDMRQAYKRMFRFYNTTRAVRGGTLETFAHADVLAFRRKLGTQEALILVNLRNRAVDYALPAALANTEWRDVDSVAVPLGTQVSLEAYGYRLLKR